MPAVLGSLDDLHRRDRLLLWATDKQDLAAVQQQLAAGANVSAKDKHGQTALHVAAGSFQGKVVAALLAAKADVSQRTTYDMSRDPNYATLDWTMQGLGLTPLQCTTAMLGRLRGRRLVLHPAGGAVLATHKCSSTCKRAVDVVEQLVAAGAQVDVRDAGEGITPLHYAAETGCPAVVAALLKAEADPGSSSFGESTVLHAAAISGRREVVQQVLGALGSSRAAEAVRVLGCGDFRLKSSPLHMAAEKGYLEVAEALVAAGADREQQDSVGSTPLVSALRCGHCHLVPLLVSPGNANVQPEGGARRCSLLGMAATCPDKWDDIKTHPQWRGALAVSAAKAVVALLAAGADAAAKDYEGLTPVEAAAAGGQPEVLQVLVDHEVQRRQQQQQQQQQASSTQVPPDLLRKLGAHALRGGNGPTWHLLLTLAADTGGVEGVRTLWGTLEQQLQAQAQQPWFRDQGHLPLEGWLGAWVAACRDITAQRSNLPACLEQLFCLHHQQQPSDHAGGASAAKRPKLAHEAPAAAAAAMAVSAPRGDVSTMAAATATPAAASAAAAATTGGGTVRNQTAVRGSSSSSSSSRSELSKARATTTANRGTGIAAAGRPRSVRPAAARGDKQAVEAALALLPDRMEGLLAAADAAGRAGHWGLCLQMLRQLVVLDEAKGRAAADKLLAAPSRQLAAVDERQRRRQQQQQQLGQQQVYGVLLADWLEAREQQQLELQHAIVRSAEAWRRQKSC